MIFPMKFILVECPALSNHIDPFFVSVTNCWRFGHPVKQHCCSTIRRPPCAQSGRSDRSTQLCTCANCGCSHNVFHRCCPVYKLESKVAVFIFKLGLTLHETRQEARWRVFLSLLIPILSFALLLSHLLNISHHFPLFLFPLPRTILPLL